MHIALVTHYYAPEVGAPQRRWSALIPRFIAAGHEVTVLAPPPHYPVGTADDLTPDLRVGARAVGEHGERICRVRFRAHGPDLVSRSIDQAVTAADSVLRGFAELRRDRPDVVVATVPGIPSIAAGYALGRLLRAPFVVEMRDAWPDLIEPSGMMGGTHPTGWRRRVTSHVHRRMTRVQRRSAAVVTTTEAFAAVLNHRGTPRVEVVRNGTYLDEVPHLPPNRPGEPLRVLYLGTVGRSQGLENAVRAAALLHESGRTIELRIVGPGADYPNLLRLAWATGAPIDLRGAVPREEVFDHYRWADSLLVSLRSWPPLHWTVPSKMYEAMATGRHITAVLAGEGADIIRATGAGDVVAPEDPEALAALWAALAEDRSRLVVGARGRAWAFQHTDYDHLADRYLKLLAEVTG